MPRPRNESTCHGPMSGTCEQKGKVIDADWLELPASLYPLASSERGKVCERKPYTVNITTSNILLEYSITRKPKHKS